MFSGSISQTNIDLIDFSCLVKCITVNEENHKKLLISSCLDVVVSSV